MIRPRLKESWIMDGGQMSFVEAAEEFMEFMDSDNYHEDRVDDYENHVFESVITELYGPDVWEWVREKQG